MRNWTRTGWVEPRALSARGLRGSFVAGVLLLVLSAYLVLAYWQRRELIEEGERQQIEQLGSVLEFIANDLIKQGRLTDLHDVLRIASKADDVFGALALSASGALIAGDAGQVHCLQGSIPQELPAEPVTGEANCGSAVTWNARPLRSGNGWIVVALKETVAERVARDAVRRQVALLSALIVALGGAGTLLLRQQKKLVTAERFAVIGRLSGGLAHELATPISVIGLHASAISERTAASSPAHAKALAINREVERLTTFMHGLLHLSRKQGVVRRHVQAADLVRKATADIARVLEDACVQLSVRLPSEPVYVLGDEALLSHAVHNVIRNAVQALRSQPAPRQIEISVERDATRVRISVADNGPGFGEAGIKRAFEPFYSTKKVQEGMGLGLPISVGIIAEHDGQIEIEDRPEGGARVTIVLPLADAR